MTKRLARPALMVAALTAAALPGPVDATYGQVRVMPCAGTVQWSFDPPLDVFAQTGTVTQSFSGACGVALVFAAHSSGIPTVGEVALVAGTTSSVIGTYTGTCDVALASFGGPQHVIVRGAVTATQYTYTVSPYAVGFVGAYATVPNQPCPISSADGVGVEGLLFAEATP